MSDRTKPTFHDHFSAVATDHACSRPGYPAALFGWIASSAFDMVADWPLARLLGYFGSYSATRRYRDRTGDDPVARYAEALAEAWGDPESPQRLRWPLFLHARRKPGG